MWVLTPIGFFSIVQKPWDVESKTLTIRSRVRDDLENLREVLPAMGPIIESDDSDYRFRVQANAVDTSAAIAKMTKGIQYDNFKNEVYRVQGRDRANVYGEVWSVLLRLSRIVSTKAAPATPRREV